MSEIQIVPIKWLWNGWLAKKKLALWQGNPDQGKSTVSLTVAAILSKGGLFPDGSQAELGETLIINAEDDEDDTSKPRLAAAGADMEKIRTIRWIITKQGRQKVFNFETYLPLLIKNIASMDNLKLIIVDPISAFMGKIDSNASSEVRGLLNELRAAAKERECAVIMIMHHNKNSGQKALDRASGSTSFGAAARLGAVFGEHPTTDWGLGEYEVEPKREFIMVCSKNNIGLRPAGLTYQIVSHNFLDENSGLEINTSKIDWTGSDNFITSQEVVDYMPNKKKKTPGRPADLFEECLKKFTELTKGRQIIEPNDVQHIIGTLSNAGFKEEMIKKARKEIGYIANVTHGQDVSWQKTN